MDADYRVMTIFRRHGPWLFALPPFGLLVWCLRLYAFENVFWDDWELLLDRFPGPGLVPNWEGIFTPYAGHRIPWLQLSVIPGVLLGDGDMRFLIGLSFVFAVACAWCLIRLTASDRSPAWWDVIIISLAVASPLYSHAWQWWICWPIFMPFACLLLGVRLLSSEKQNRFWIHFSAAMGLSVVAALAHGSGGLVWLALFPCLWHSLDGQPLRRKLEVLAIFFTVGTVIILPFLLDVPNETGNESTTVSATRPFHLVHYALTLAGGNLGQGIAADPVTPSKIIGAMLLIDVALISLLFVSRIVSGDLRRKLCPWLSVAWFGSLSTLAIAVGRSELPDEQALGGRYLLLAYPLYLGLYFAFRVLMTHNFFQLNERSRFASVVIVTTLLGALQANAWIEGRQEILLGHARHLARVAPVNFSLLFPRHIALKRATVNVEGMADLLERLDREEKLDGYRVYRTHDFSQFKGYDPHKPLDGGHVAAAATEASGAILIDGFAYLHTADRPADLILLTLEPAGDESRRTIFEMVPMTVRDDFYRSYERFRHPDKFTAWSVRVQPGRLPPGETIVRAWAFDHERKQVHILRNNLTVRNGVLTTLNQK